MTVCPVCSSNKVNSTLVTHQITILRAEREYVELHSLCEDCGESGEFDDSHTHTNTRMKEEAIRSAIIIEVNRLLGESDHSNSCIERMLGLPQTTLSKWAKDGASLAELFLLNAYLDNPEHIVAISQPRG